MAVARSFLLVALAVFGVSGETYDGYVVTQHLFNFFIIFFIVLR